MKLLLSPIAFILFLVLNGFCIGQEQEYKVGDTITLLSRGDVIETKITGIEGIWIKYKFLFASDGLEEFVGSMQIPPPEWIKQDIDVNKFYARIKGNEVSIDISALGFDGITRGAIETFLSKQVKEAGGTVGAIGRMKIIGSKRAGVTENRSYKERETGQMHTISITPCMNELVVLFDDKEIWRSEGATKTTISSETIAEIQASANQAATPDPSFYLLSKIPKSIPLNDAWKDVPSYQTN